MADSAEASRETSIPPVKHGGIFKRRHYQLMLPHLSTSASGAEFSPDKVYRYRLWRIWDASRPRVAWCLLNPSTADDLQDDPTIRRCIGFARRWGYGGVEIVNLFAIRATDPRAIRQQADTIGPDNDKAIFDVVTACEKTICAWGNRGRYRKRDSYVLSVWQVLPKLWCLGMNDNGTPKHPLYVRGTAELRRFP
jgi:hypothetical protein